MGPDGGAPDWSEDSYFVAMTLGAAQGGLYIAFNAGHKALTAALPRWPGRCWRALIDTGKVCTAAMAPNWVSATARCGQVSALAPMQ